MSYILILFSSSQSTSIYLFPLVPEKKTYKVDRAGATVPTLQMRNPKRVTDLSRVVHLHTRDKTTTQVLECQSWCFSFGPCFLQVAIFLLLWYTQNSIRSNRIGSIPNTLPRLAHDGLCRDHLGGLKNHKISGLQLQEFLIYKVWSVDQ